MKDKLREAIDRAVCAFIAARSAGVEEFHLIGEIFDASNEFTAAELKKSGKLPVQKTLMELIQEKHLTSN